MNLRGKLLHQDDEFGISFEDKDGLAFCHCHVYKSTHGVLRRCREKIEELQMSHQRDAYGVSKLSDKKHHKFLVLMGFEHFKNSWVVDDDDQDQLISIFIRRL
jgi:hypothetical protein